MSSLRRVEVGDAGLRYASDVLAADGGLSKALRREWSRFHRASALLPFDLAPQVTMNFLAGGVFPAGDGFDSPEGVRSSDAALAAMIDAFLRGSSTHLAIIEDFNRVRGDARLDECDWVAYSGREVYHLCIPPTSPDRIKQIVRAAHTGPIFIGTLSSLPPVWQVRPGEEIVPVMFDTMARTAQCVIVGAYGGESYLLIEP